MYVVSLDTTTKTFCLGCVQDENVLGRIIITGEGYQSENFLLYLKRILDDVKISIQDVDCFSISIGPGSLTGVRVGLSFLKGIGYSLNIPVIPVNTLYAIFYEFKEKKKNVCPMLLTRKNRVFCALYHFDGVQDSTVIEQTCLEVEEFLDVVPEDETFFVGSGAVHFRDTIKKKMGDIAHFGGVLLFPDPAVIALIGQEKMKKGTIPQIDKLEPIYLS